jgi:hypothetical protein
MQHKEDLLNSMKNQLSYEKQLRDQLEDQFQRGSTRDNRISFLESCINEVDTLFGSLERLAALAKNDTGGSRVAGLFLVNLFNSIYSHFDLRDLNILDHSYWEDAMNVLKLDSINHRELYEYLDDGEKILHDLIDRWGNTPKAKDAN